MLDLGRLPEPGRDAKHQACIYDHNTPGGTDAVPGSRFSAEMATVKSVSVHSRNEDLRSVMATVTVFDPHAGFPLAIMEGTHLTARRPGAAGGIAATYRARPDAGIATFIGPGGRR